MLRFQRSFSVFYIIDCLTTTDNMPSTITKRNFNNKNTAKFSRKLYNQNWSDIYNKTDAQCAFSILQRVIDQLIEDVFPEQTSTVTYKTRLPWLNAELKAEKAELPWQICANKIPKIKKMHMKYKRNRNLVTAQLRNAHIAYQSNESDIVKNDISKS